jgi:putative oxidoreductase
LFVFGVQGVADHVVTVLGLPMPLAWAYFLGILECFGGAALAVGFLTRPIALMLTIEFVIITFWHYGNGYVFSSPHGGYEYPLVLCWCFTPRFSSAVPAVARLTA